MRSWMIALSVSALLSAVQLYAGALQTNTVINPHWCLVNGSGDAPQGCTGPKLTDQNVAAFSSYYHHWTLDKS